MTTLVNLGRFSAWVQCLDFEFSSVFFIGVFSEVLPGDTAPASPPCPPLAVIASMLGGGRREELLKKRR